MFPQPCAGRWVKVPGIEGPVDALRTEYEPNEVAFDRAAQIPRPGELEDLHAELLVRMK